MSDAFKCDRCGQLSEGVPALTLELNSGVRVQLCSADTENFYRWMDRKPEDAPHMRAIQRDSDAYMKRLRESAEQEKRDQNIQRASATDCPRCWQHGFNRTHGLMEVCPYNGR